MTNGKAGLFSAFGETQFTVNKVNEKTCNQSNFGLEFFKRNIWLIYDDVCCGKTQHNHVFDYREK